MLLRVCIQLLHAQTHLNLCTLNSFPMLCLYLHIVYFFSHFYYIFFFPKRVASLLTKVVQEIERRISTQEEHIQNVRYTLHIYYLRHHCYDILSPPQQNNLIKACEEKYQSRIRVLETLASGTGEEIKVNLD